MSIHTPETFRHPAPRPAQAPIPVHRAEDLTGGGCLANIDLGGQVYALRITRAGKLILTK
jgi:hemin uptake protein HemP